MKLTEVLVKPILTEKANKQQQKLRTYTFKVDKRANKLEIKTAIEQFYGVTVLSVNTSVSPGKNKARRVVNTVGIGKTASYKKAYVRVGEGDSIDLYTNI